ncbi:MAG TPA: Smr/MutS family protein, partial [Saprospiraceae bacterium]|nr:Smr/MutS family protein [Saprospiraceae bacterium]
RAGGAVGRIVRLRGNKADIALGELTVTAALRDLLPAVEPIRQVSTVTATDLQQSAAFDAKIDLRGMSKDEALMVLERFVDNALLSSASLLRILHGKGDGVLRKTVRQKLREYGGNVGRIYHPEQDNGGDGVTIVELV